MARNKFDVDENLESPFSFRHLKRAMKYIGRHRFKMILALLLSIIASVSTLYQPVLMQKVLDEAVPNKDIALLGRLALLFVGIVVISIAFTTIRARVMAHVSQEIIYDIREDLFAHLQRLPFSYYDSRPAGKILVRVINYVNSVSDMLSNGIINSILEIVNGVYHRVHVLHQRAAGYDRGGRSPAFRGGHLVHQAPPAEILAGPVQQKLQL